ncbi:MAG: hypothetical protein OXK74_15835, partial [Gemmatimonadota bacterium]|nr:hypothetical protein [Gemmatimonadota bacterium]
MTQPTRANIGREPFFLVISGAWLNREPGHAKRMRRQRLLPIGAKPGYLTSGCQLFLKYMTAESTIVIDDAAQLSEYKGEFYIRGPRIMADSRESRHLQR